MVEGISHITLIVRDLEKSTALLQAVFEARQVYDSGQAQFSLACERFLLLGDIWLCLMEGPPLPARSYNHIAFQIPEAEYAQFYARVAASGAEMRPGRPRVEGEGQSIYFYDYDNHLFELHTGTLEERLQRYKG